jgi:hypothetical protein
MRSRGQTAVTDRVGGRGAIVDEADKPEPELAVLQNPVRDHAAEIPRADDEHLLEADARAPALAQQVARDLAREVREHDAESEKEDPDPARDLEEPLRLERLVQVVRVDVERAADAEERRDEVADEHAEEVVHARAAAPEPVETLQLEREDQHQADERRENQIPRERRLAFGDRNHAGLEPEQVGHHEREHRGAEVRGHVDGDEQPVEAS